MNRRTFIRLLGVGLPLVAMPQASPAASMPLDNEMVALPDGSILWDATATELRLMRSRAEISERVLRALLTDADLRRMDAIDQELKRFIAKHAQMNFPTMGTA